MPVKITLPGKTPSGSALANPFAEQLEFFRNKLNLPSDRYDDIIKSAHDRAFIVAGAANADLLNDLNGAIRKSIEEGRGLQEFRKDFNALVLKHGWTGWTGEGSAAGQAWRTNIIYQTNMATSYAAGRWKQLTDPGLLAIRPYWRYVHADGVMHPRPLHVSWNGLVLPHDHPFWLTHFAPNGYLCHCRVTSADAAEYAAAEAAGRGAPPAGWDKLDPKTGAPVGIDKGFDYAPGANTSRPLKSLIDNKLIRLDAPVGAAMYDTMRPLLKAEQEAGFASFLGKVLADPGAQGRTAVVGAIDSATLDWLAGSKAAYPATAEIALQDALITGTGAPGQILSAEEWAGLAELVDGPQQILFVPDTSRLVFVGAPIGRGVPLAVELAYQEKGSAGRNLIESVYRVTQSTIASGIAAGLYEVIR